MRNDARPIGPDSPGSPLSDDDDSIDRDRRPGEEPKREEPPQEPERSEPEDPTMPSDHSKVRTRI
jgi:hypothetical protein